MLSIISIEKMDEMVESLIRHPEITALGERWQNDGSVVLEFSSRSGRYYEVEMLEGRIKYTIFHRKGAGVVHRFANR